VVEVPGKRVKGVLVSDCFTAYDARGLSEWLQQKCFAHFLKELSKPEREKKRGAVRFPREMARLLREAMAWGEGRLDELIAEGRKFTDADNARFAGRLRKQRGHLLRFL